MSLFLIIWLVTSYSYRSFCKGLPCKTVMQNQHLHIKFRWIDGYANLGNYLKYLVFKQNETAKLKQPCWLQSDGFGSVWILCGWALVGCCTFCSFNKPYHSSFRRQGIFYSKKVVATKIIFTFSQLSLPLFGVLAWWFGVLRKLQFLYFS